MTATVVNVKTSPCQVYIGRGGGTLTPSIWGNPFKIGEHGSREDVIAAYQGYLLRTPKLLARIPSLRGKSLGCHCHPLACHGDILAALANQEHLWRFLVPYLTRDTVVGVLEEWKTMYTTRHQEALKQAWEKGQDHLGNLVTDHLKEIGTEIARLRVAWNTVVDEHWRVYRLGHPNWQADIKRYLGERV